MSKYLITGGCGFIGSHLTAALHAAGAEIHVLDDLSAGRREVLPQGVALSIGDVADADLVRRAMQGCDGCFHLAARTAIQDSLVDWRGTHRSNQTGSVAVFDAARSFTTPVPVVYASSASVYGDNPALPLPESAMPAPLTAYAADKLGSEMHGRAAWFSHRIPNTGLRFFNVYGPFDRDAPLPNAGVVAAFVTRVLNDQPITIHGDGSQKRDFIHVKDVVAHLLAAMRQRQDGCRVYNTCSGQPISILALAAMIGEIVGRPPRLHFGPPRTGDIQHSLGDPSRATAELGVAATITLPDGLRQMLAFLQDATPAQA